MTPASRLVLAHGAFPPQLVIDELVYRTSEQEGDVADTIQPRRSLEIEVD